MELTKGRERMGHFGLFDVKIGSVTSRTFENGAEDVAAAFEAEIKGKFVRVGVVESAFLGATWRWRLKIKDLRGIGSLSRK